MSLHEMSGAAAHYEQRGGLLQRPLHSYNDASFNVGGGQAQSKSTSSSNPLINEHDYRFPRRPAGDSHAHEALASDPATLRITTKNSSARALPDTLDSSSASSARKDLLRENFFPSWKDDSHNNAEEEVESPDEMQKKDPLATQIWRLYSKTKKQLPNQERMENLTWRMMAMSLRKHKKEEAAR